jgi:DNA-binding transcriptional regulator LsrR (DeoR family)
MRHRKPVASPNAFSADAIARAACLYYVESLTQAEIARVLGVGRARVIALLAAAREGGVVRVRIDARTTRQADLERALVARFRLREAVVAPAPASDASAAAVVGHAAGIWLADQLREGLSIGIGWGDTLHAAVRAFDAKPRRRLEVISLLGGITHSRTMMPATVARRLADACGADCYQLAAPLIVANATMAGALMAEPGVQALRTRLRDADLALASVGDISAQATLFRESVLSAAERASLERAGAVGDLLCRFLDASGRVVDHPVNQRVVAVGLDELSRIPRIVIASGGRRKIAALRAALAAVPVSVLVTEEVAARGLLESSPG